MSETVDPSFSEPHQEIFVSVFVLLQKKDGSREMLETDRRVLELGTPLVSRKGVLFVYRGTKIVDTGKHVRLYWEAEVVEL